MPTQTQTNTSLHYCERIVPTVAKEYAKQYRSFLTGQTAKVPEVPQGMTTLAAQNIRIHIKCLLD